MFAVRFFSWKKLIYHYIYRVFRHSVSRPYSLNINVFVRTRVLILGDIRMVGKSLISKALFSVLLLAFFVVPALAVDNGAIDNSRRTPTILTTDLKACPPCGWAPLKVDLQACTNVPCNPTYCWHLGLMNVDSGRKDNLKQTLLFTTPVSVTASNTKGQSATSCIKCIDVKCAMFCAVQDRTCPLQEDFTYIGTKIPGSTYCWDFGDKCKQETTNCDITHKYKCAGTYNVVLTVKNGNVPGVGKASASVKVCPIMPLAGATVTPTNSVMVEA